MGQKEETLFLTCTWCCLITNDGVTISSVKTSELGASTCRIWVSIRVKEVATKTNDVAGYFGTTTATLLAQAIIREGLKMLQKQALNPMILKKGISKAVEGCSKRNWKNWKPEGKR